MADEQNPRVWTVWADHMATGEGRTLLLLICYAKDADGAKAAFARQFGDYFAFGCEAEPGVVCNSVTTFLLSEAALKLVNSVAGNLYMFASLHLNFS